MSSSKTQKPGKLFILSAPSGGGKSTVLNALLKDNPNFYYSISYTTRAPRKGEIDGVHYHFVNRQEFYNMARTGEFLEYAKVHRNFYGTSKKIILEKLEKGKACLLDIDVQGMKQIVESSEKMNIRNQLISIFLLPPSMEILEERLRKRKSDTEKTILRRLKNAKREIEQAGIYDYHIINNNLVETILEVKKIIAENGFIVN